MSPLRRTIAISLLSPRERSNATMSPAGDHTGFESLRPRAMGTSGRMNSGSIPDVSPALAASGSSPAAGHATAGKASATNRAIRGRLRCITFGPARLRFLDLIAVSARPLASLHEGRIALELFREEVEVLSPREARAVHHRRLLGHQIQLLVLGQGEDRLELGDRVVVVLFLVEVDITQPPVRLGVVRVLALGGGIGLDGTLDVALLARALADLEEILLQHDAALAGAILLLLGELHHLEEIAVVLAVGQAHAVKAQSDLLAGGDRRLADLL